MCPDDPVEVTHVPGHEVGHPSVLQVALDHLHRVEVWGVRGQSLQMQAGEASAQVADRQPLVVAAAGSGQAMGEPSGMLPGENTRPAESDGMPVIGRSRTTRRSGVTATQDRQARRPQT